MSKSFGLAGWRVGYAVYPSWASDEMVKVQDALPTHACTASQKIALAALEGAVPCASNPAVACGIMVDFSPTG